jgi:hypothetical protein
MDEQIRPKHRLPEPQRQALREQYAKATAPWSGKAQRIEPTLEELARRQGDIDSGKIPF